MQSSLISSLAVAAAKVGLVKQAAPPIGKFVANLFTKQVPNLAHGAAPGAMKRVMAPGRALATTAGAAWAGGHANNAIQSATAPKLDEFDQFKQHQQAAQTASHNAMLQSSELMAQKKWGDLQKLQQQMATGEYGATATQPGAVMRFLNPFHRPDPLTTMNVNQHGQAQTGLRDQMAKHLDKLQTESNQQLGAAQQNRRMIESMANDESLPPAYRQVWQAKLKQQDDIEKLFPGGRSPEYSAYLQRMQDAGAGGPRPNQVAPPWVGGHPPGAPAPASPAPSPLNAPTQVANDTPYSDPSLDPVIQYRRSRFSIDPSQLNNRY